MTAPFATRFGAGEASSYRLGWRFALIVIAYTASLLGYQLGSTRTLTFHEVIFAQPAKEMLASGNWVLPTMGQTPWTEKPPLLPWLIAGSMQLFGSQTEAVVRLPSVICAVLLAWLVASLAARWFGSQTGLLAGLMQASMHYVLQMGRLAEADMLLATVVSGALACLGLAQVDCGRGRNQTVWPVLGFYVATGLAFLTKGLIGVAFIGGACGLWFLWNQDLRGLKFFLHPLGIALFLAVILPWPIAAYQQHPAYLQDQIMHHFGRFKGDLGGQKAWYFYPLNFLFVTLPWSPLLLLAIVRGFRQGLYAHPVWRFCVCWVLPGLVLLSLSKFQSKHYLCPLLPPATMLAAEQLRQLLAKRKWLAPKQWPIPWTAWLLGSAAAITGVALGHSPAKPALFGLVGILSAGVAGVIALDRRRMVRPQLMAIFALAWVVAAGALTQVLPKYDSYKDQTRLAAQVNNLVPADKQLFVVELPINQIYFYLRPEFVRVDILADFCDRVYADRQGRAGLGREQLFVLAPQNAQETLEKLGRCETKVECASFNRYLRSDQRLTLFQVELEPTRLAERLWDRDRAAAPK